MSIFSQRISSAIQIIFKLGFEPKDEYFSAANQEILQMTEANNSKMKKKLFIIKHEQKNSIVFFLTRREKEDLIFAANFLNEIYATNFAQENPRPEELSFTQKLRILAFIMPKYLSAGSDFESS